MIARIEAVKVIDKATAPNAEISNITRKEKLANESMETRV